uniref:Bridging integrator 3 n=1 Tax=Steinernema glaseri TaxID=37863 RepID=A0A1I7Z8B7_9BILA
MEEAGRPTTSADAAKKAKPAKAPKRRKQFHSVTALLAQNQEVAFELQQAQNVVDEGRLQFREAVADVHRKYQKDLRALIDKRNEMIEGIPNFWRTALRNHPIVGTILTEADKDCLRYVRRVELRNHPIVGTILTEADKDCLRYVRRVEVGRLARGQRLQLQDPLPPQRQPVPREQDDHEGLPPDRVGALLPHHEPQVQEEHAGDVQVPRQEKVFAELPRLQVLIRVAHRQADSSPRRHRPLHPLRPNTEPRLLLQE